MDKTFEKILNNFKEGYKTGLKKAIESREESICSTAPYPECNGANGCDTCKHQQEDN